jgi:hypothetical protein
MAIVRAFPILLIGMLMIYALMGFITTHTIYWRRFFGRELHAKGIEA